jgi:integrase
MQSLPAVHPTMSQQTLRALRAAEWSEFDLANAEWRIPAARTKMGEQHIVPLARQAVAILRELEPLARRGSYVFPSLLTRDRPMSNNTINTALRRLGYASNEQTGHGFRSMASTLLNEQGFAPDVIELQLAHSERNKVRAAYNKAQRLPERRKLMQAWADYLDDLRERARVWRQRLRCDLGLYARVRSVIRDTLFQTRVAANRKVA